MNEIKTDQEYDKSVEYQQAIAYLHHMYDTRHRIFQFGILINAGLLGVVFKLAESTIARVSISTTGFLIILSLTLMAIRSDQYRIQIERYTEELELKLGFGLVRITNQRMPKGLDSTKYLFYSYWAMAFVWALLLIYFLFEAFGLLAAQI